jgi:hypothetical protein
MIGVLFVVVVRFEDSGFGVWVTDVVNLSEGLL